MAKAAKPPDRPQKVRRRRPKGSGSYSIIPVRVSPELVAAIDKVARNLGISRSECIRQFLEAGLKRRPKP